MDSLIDRSIPNYCQTGATLDRPVNKVEPLASLIDTHNSSSTTANSGDNHSHSGKLVFLLSAPGFPCLRQLSARDPALLYHRSVPHLCHFKGCSTYNCPILRY